MNALQVKASNGALSNVEQGKKSLQPTVVVKEESIQHQELNTANQWKSGETDSITPMRDMGGKEKKILVMANVPNYQGSDKRTLCNESVSGKKNVQLSSSAVPPPIPMSPVVEKMEGLKAIRNRSNSLRLGRLAFYRHLEKVETMRCFWELKHVELEGGNQQVLLVGGREEARVAGEGFTCWAGGLTAQRLFLSESVVSKRLIIQLQERDYFIINVSPHVNNSLSAI
ncbi:uncharacterized protein [Notothenia coriiceps]|uniref:Uncharacterized protein n=1 Tax=Notothenia coriiceps TaxID=8208 RepID=A0A6I9N8C5_9TELE|nr:PREDICTED: uncharacterized protein LOC104946479 [Notothenia coriiceps]